MSEGTLIDTPGKHTAGYAPPDEYHGWRQEDTADWSERDPLRHALRRHRVLVVAIVALVLAEAAGVLVWIANSHYDRGQNAFNMGVYDTAANEFAAARILVFPYRDAASMERAARSALDTQGTVTQAEAAAKAQLLATLQSAGTKLAAGHAAGVLAALKSARAQVPKGPLSDDAEIQQVAADLQVRLLTAARAMLAKTRWHKAVLYAAGALLLDPADAKATAVAGTAKKDEALQAKLNSALAAARAHRWKRALALALSVLKAHPGFPGAANVVSEARVALRPKPAAKPARSTAPASTPTTPPTTPAPAPQPPPPPPPP